MTTFVKLTSPNTQAAAPFTTALAFKRGDIPVSLVLDIASYQVVVKRRWNDGSVKHAVVSGRAPLTANVALQVNASPGTPPAGTALTAANITAANPSASIQCGTLGTISLSTLTASAPFRTWISGPEMVECHYRASVGATLLSVWFFVRLYASGAVHVRAIVENGYLDNGAGGTAANADIAYIPTITIGGSVVYNNGGAALTHCRNTRWTAQGWIGTDPQVTPQHDVVYLQRSAKLTPNYPLANPSSSKLDSLNQAYVPMANGAINPVMAVSGHNPSIALLPEWDAEYLASGDPRAYRAVLAASSALNSFAICWRDFNTKTVIKPSAFANWSIYGPGEGGDSRQSRSNGTEWEVNHHPGEGYLAYLLTGDYWHYETMLLQASFLYAIRYTGQTGVVMMGAGTSRILVLEVRGTAWTLRSLAQTCALAPDDELVAGGVAAEYRTLLANNYAYWKATADTPGINQLGYLYEYGASGAMDAYGQPGISPCWQHNWWQGINGFASDIEPLADMTTLNYVRDWMYKGVVGLLGDASGFYFGDASVYAINISTSSSLDPTTWRDSWADVYAATYAYLAGGAASIAKDNRLVNGADPTSNEAVPGPTGGSGDPSQAPYSGRWGYLLPAIAYAVEHGATGAAAAWARITGAANYATLTGSGFDQEPQWGVFPRNIAVAASAGIGPTTRVGDGNWIPGCTVVSNTGGLGVLAQNVPSTGDDGQSPLFKSLRFPDDQDCEVRCTLVTGLSNGGSLTLGEGGEVGYIGPADSVTLQFWRAGLTVDTPKLLTLTDTGTGTGSTVSGVTVTPSTATGSTTFAATVAGSGSPSQAVTWSRSGSAGTINASSGAFTAPAQASTVQVITITATSVQDGTKSGTATVTIAAAPVVTVSGVTVMPGTPSIAGGALQQFAASVAGANGPPQTVSWSSTIGTINPSTGLFTAPATTGATQTGTVTATSTFDQSKSGSAAVTIPAAGVVLPTVSSVEVTPATATIAAGETRQYTAAVIGANSPGQGVAWEATDGFIDANGLFTPPSAQLSVQTVTITATSSVDATKSGTAVIYVDALPGEVTVSNGNMLEIAADGSIVDPANSNYYMRGREYYIAKDPDAVMLYGLDLAHYLARAGHGITVVAVEAVPVSVTLSRAATVQGTQLVMQLSGGTGALTASLDAAPRCTFRFTLSNGDVDDFTIWLDISDR